MKKPFVVTAFCLAATVFAFAPTATASTIYDFTATNFAIQSSAPYGTVTLTDDTYDGNAAVRFDISLDSNLFMILDAFGFSTDAADLHVTSLDSPYTAWDTTGSNRMDGFGTFSYIIDGPNWGEGGSASTLHFVVYNLPAGVDAATLLTDNGSGHLVAAHVYDVLAETNAQTGFISDGSNPVPEPASMLLLGTGLLGAGFLRRRRK